MNVEHPIKLLLVDDSLFIRNSLKKVLTVPDIEIVGLATNGEEAIKKNLELQPDIILLDIQMPVMNGLDALKHIMRTRPTAVLVFSSVTIEGSEESIEALSLGAVDFITKDAPYDIAENREELIRKIVELGSNSFLKARFNAKRAQAGSAHPELHKEEDKHAKTATHSVASNFSATVPHYLTSRHRPDSQNVRVVCIGISTGGPVALQEVLPALPANFPVPILIVQHMPPHFTESLAKRLDQSSAIHVVEASDGESLRAGTVYIAKGGLQMTVTKQNTISLSNSFPNELFKPAVNVMMKSVVDVYKDRAIGIIMTGMGNDGTIGLTSLYNAGGYVIAQSPETCVVAGMPRSVIDSNIASEIQPLSSIAPALVSILKC